VPADLALLAVDRGTFSGLGLGAVLVTLALTFTAQNTVTRAADGRRAAAPPAAQPRPRAPVK